MTFPKSFQVGGNLPIPLVISNKTAAYTVQATDAGTIINCTSGTFTVSLTAAATLASGFNVTIWNTSNTQANVITIDPAGAETIDGLTTLLLRRGEGMQIVCNGTNWETGAKKVMRGYAENIHSTTARAIATGNTAIAIGSSATSSGTNCIAIGTSSSSSGSYSFAAYGDASGNFSTAITNGATASSASSTAIGQNSGGNGAQAVTGSGAMALGGSYASGTDSFAAAIANNTSTYGATGANSVAIGLRAKATNTYSIALGYEHIVSGTYSVAIGGFGANDNGVTGKFILGSSFNAAGQSGTTQIRASTTDATATILLTGGGAANTINQVILPNNSAYAFAGTIVARRDAAGGTASAAWKIEGLIRREGTAASTTLVASTVTAISNVPGWVIALTADTTNGGLAVTATGAAATNIKWLATINTTEVTYA